MKYMHELSLNVYDGCVLQKRKKKLVLDNIFVLENRGELLYTFELKLNSFINVIWHFYLIYFVLMIVSFILCFDIFVMLCYCC